MEKIVFDIETVGLDFKQLDKKAQEYLLKSAVTEEEKKEAIQQACFNPLASEIAAICLINPDTDRGAVYFQAPGAKVQSFVEDGIEFQAMNEKEILQNFWEKISNYRQIVTFNGRGFDCPFIMLRSAVHRIYPTKNLMPPRFDSAGHLDLMEQLSFYGAFRRYSLDFYCRSFGLECKMDGIEGGQVGEYFKKKKYEDIARYCVQDVRATAALYKYWEKYIKF